MGIKRGCVGKGSGDKKSTPGGPIGGGYNGRGYSDREWTDDTYPSVSGPIRMSARIDKKINPLKLVEGWWPK